MLNYSAYRRLKLQKNAAELAALKEKMKDFESKLTDTRLIPIRQDVIDKELLEQGRLAKLELV
jgi:hypothetical protein